jgi:HSP20 family protein
MSLLRWDPFKDVAVLQDRINRLFADAFPRSAEPDDEMSLSAWRPAVDIFETDTALVLKAELPGIRKEDVTVEVKENVLTIKGERIREDAVSEENYYRQERYFGTFSRSFSLRYPVNPEKIKAKFKDGILEVEVPKPEEEKPKQVTVDVE